MNQTDLIQNIIAAEHQAQALTQDARDRRQNLDEAIAQEIEAMRLRYQQKAQETVRRAEERELQSRARELSALDDKLAAQLQRIEDSYRNEKDAWVQALFQRIVGKAGR